MSYQSVYLCRSQFLEVRLVGLGVPGNHWRDWQDGQFALLGQRRWGCSPWAHDHREEPWETISKSHSSQMFPVGVFED